MRARAAIRREVPSLQPATLKTVFLQGVLTNVLNPKVALFFLAFLPQFVDPGASNKALALLFLGFVFNFNGTLWNLFVAWSAARVARRLSGGFALWLNRTVGVLFVFLGIRLVTSHEV
jgi:threonine/homoserine/homoserine lactone efflux protein